MKNRIIIERLGSTKKTLQIAVGENEHLTFVLLGIDEMGEKTVEISLVGPGASADIVGIIIGESGVGSVHTLQRHVAPDTKSDLLIKSVLFGSSSLHYDGLIKIEKKAQKSNAYQRNENLLMGESANVFTKPELEIAANDVRCTHGATIGVVDEEVLFYLCSRGIPKKEAEKLVISGFFAPVLARIPEKQAKKIDLSIRRKLATINY